MTDEAVEGAKRSGFVLTGLARPLGLRNRSNVFVLVVAALAGIAGGILATAADFEGRADYAEVVRIALWWATSAFLAWAIARELDPDRPLVASVAAVLGGAAGAVAPSLVAAFAVLLAVRAIAGTTGLKLTPLDQVVLVALAVWCGLSRGAWPAGLVAAGALWAQPLWQQPAVWFRISGSVAATGCLAAAIFSRHPMSSSGEGPWAPLAGLVVLVAWLIYRRPPQPVSTTDFGGEPLSRGRLIMARSAAAAAALLISMLFMRGALIAAPMVLAVLSTALMGSHFPFPTRRAGA